MHTAIGNAINQWIAAVAFTASGGWVVVSGAGVRTSSGIPSACATQIDNYVNADSPITCVAFGPSNSWIVVSELGATASGIPASCWTEVTNRVNAGQEITCVAFTASGGWAVLSDSSPPTASGIPSACFTKLQQYAGSPLTWAEQVAFTPSGGWTVLGRSGNFFASGIPDACYDRMLECRDVSLRRPTHVAFSPSGGWHVSGNDLVQMPAPTGGLAAVRNIMTSTGIPGVQVAVVEDRVVTVRHNYGTVHRGSAFAVGNNTRFQCASVSKTVAAAGALRAIELQLVSGLTLDTDLRPNLGIAIPGVSSAVTLRQLLSHTGGFNVGGFNGYRRPLLWGSTIPGTLGILQGNGNSAQVRRVSAVGNYVYSGGGYVIVQRFIEQVSGQSYSTWMWNNVLSPIGMTSSSFVLDPTWENANLAVGHHSTSFPVEHRRHAYPEFTAAGLYSTAGDLARLVITIDRGGLTPGGTRVWSSALSTQMLTRQTPAGQTPYGLGVVLGTDGANGGSFWHNGVNVGFRTYLWGNPAGDNGVVVLSNYDQVDANGQGITTAVASIANEYIDQYNL